MEPESKIPSIVTPCRETFRKGMHKNFEIPDEEYQISKVFEVMFRTNGVKARLSVLIDEEKVLQEDGQKKAKRACIKEEEENESSTLASRVQLNTFGDGVLDEKPSMKPVDAYEKWPRNIDVSLGGPNKHWMCSLPIINSSNCAVIERMLLWKQKTVAIIDSMLDAYPFGKNTGSEQHAMTLWIVDICENIAASCLPVTLMGAKQIKREFSEVKSIEEGQLVENLAFYDKFFLHAHFSSSMDSFHIITTHYNVGGERTHILYGAFGLFQPVELSAWEMIRKAKHKVVKKEEPTFEYCSSPMPKSM